MGQASINRQDQEDWALLAACRAGDPRGLQGLYQRYYKKIYQMAYRMLGTPEEAEDLVVDVFLKIWQKSKSFKGQCKLSTWIHQIASNLAVDRLRARRHRATLSLDALPTPELLSGYRTGPEGNPEVSALRSEENTLLYRALEQLPDQDRLLVVLYHLEEMSYAEIQEITGLSNANIKSRLFRARQRLKQLISAFEQGAQEQGNEMQERQGETGGLCFAAVRTR